MGRLINPHNFVTAVQSTSGSEAALALVAGAILGFIFAKLKLPAPAPLAISGILGIIGIWAGYVLGK